MKRLKKPSLSKLNHPLKRAKAPEEKVTEALSNVPRITNETVGEHREEVLSSARKYIYPLQHSKHRVVRISVALLLTAVIGFVLICTLSLYKFQNTSGFMYDVTRVLPFPVAKAGSDWVSYESYLFELRRNMHYYRTQQLTNFSTPDGKTQLERLKQQAMARVIEDAYVKQLAEQHKVSVSNREVDNEVALVRSQNRLGSSDRVFNDVLSQFWGWTEDDFRRKLKQQLLQQKVVAKLDTVTQKRAQDALQQIKGGADFAALAGQVSDDQNTKGNGGQYPAPITPADRDISPAITHALSQLKAGQTSDIINTGYTLEIVKVIEATTNSVRAAHIQFNLKSINEYVAPLQKQNPSKPYIKT